MKKHFAQVGRELQPLHIDSTEDEKHRIELAEFDAIPLITLGQTKKSVRQVPKKGEYDYSMVIVEFTTPVTSEVVVERYNRYYSFSNLVITNTKTLSRKDKRLSDKTWEKNVEDFLNEQKMNLEDYRVTLDYAVTAYNQRIERENDERFKRAATRIASMFETTPELQVLYDQKKEIQNKIDELSQKLYTEKQIEVKKLIESSEELNATAKQYYINEINKRMETPYKSRGFPFH